LFHFCLLSEKYVDNFVNESTTTKRKFTAVTNDGVLEDISLASRILEDIFKVIGLGFGLGT